MNDREIVATAWNNGKHHRTGAGYGLKVSVADRDTSFERRWGTVALWLPDLDHSIHVSIGKDSFWNSTCRELISKDIGRWLLKSRLAPWPPGDPPRLMLRPVGDGAFEVRAV
jgi:hypothetical protein